MFLCDYDPHGTNIMLNYIFGSIGVLGNAATKARTREDGRWVSQLAS